MPKFIDLTGQKFGRLKVIKQAGKDKYGHIKWLCQCDCGKEIIVLGNHLRSENTKSCGCLNKEKIRQRFTKHGHHGDRTYESWAHMIQRCINPNNKDYRDYGGRGITICNRWMKFPNFLKDMGERPPRYTLERIKNGKGYYKSNCKWATPKEQARNRRNNRLITCSSKTQTMIEWSEETGIPYNTLISRFRRGWSPEKALMTSARKNNGL